jgi:hypothetical protein
VKHLRDARAQARRTAKALADAEGRSPHRYVVLSVEFDVRWSGENKSEAMRRALHEGHGRLLDRRTGFYVDPRTGDVLDGQLPAKHQRRPPRP